MAAAVAAFFILLTVVAEGHGKDPFIKACPNMACVEEVIEAAFHSPYVRRLQVFSESFGRSQISGATPFPPMLDLTFN